MSASSPVELHVERYRLRELADILRGPTITGTEPRPILLTRESALKLAEWLLELERARDAIHEARCALARAEKSDAG